MTTETLTTATETASIKTGAKRGKKPTFASKKQVAEFLATIKETGTTRTGSEISYYLLRQLRKEGYIEPVKASEKKERGRYGKIFKVTGKGRSLIPLFVKAKKVTAITTAAE